MLEKACIHCGVDCGKNPIIYDDKPFCCIGCKTVYQLLNENKLNKYYEIADTPGIKTIDPDYGNKYAFLDHEEVISKMLEFRESGTASLGFYVPAIHCSSCIWLLENLKKLNSGIIHSEVHFTKKEVYVTFKEEEISLRQVVELMASLHYIPQITLDKLDSKGRIKADKSLIYKIGVAGFCFGNVMLFSFPDYVSNSLELPDNFKEYFGYVNLILSIPVLLYSGYDYIITAVKNLFKKNITIDLPISIGIMALFLQSVSEIVMSSGQGYFDSLTGFIFFILIGKWYQGKTYKALAFDRDYKSYFPVAVTRIINGIEDNVMLKDLLKGDIIRIRNQELIPADSVLLKGNANIDYSFVTGESAPVEKKSGENLFAGGRQIGSSIEMTVVKEVSQSRLTQMWNKESDTTDDKKRLSSVIDSVSKYFTLAIILIASITAIYWILVDSSKALNTFTSVLIVACPCALALSIPFAYGNAMRLLGSSGIYLKGAEVIEKLSKVTAIVFDKTGTLTQTDKSNVKFVGSKLSPEQEQIVKSVTSASTHPASVAVYNSLPSISLIDTQDYTEKAAMGIEALLNGQKVLIGSEKFVTGNTSGGKNLSTRVFLSIDDKTIGYYLLENTYRPGLEKIISGLRKKFELHLLSGDNDYERNNLIPLFENESRMHFYQAPHDKLQYVRNLKNDGANVLMVGDGLNDAGALNESDTGISIADNIHHFSPACDAIIDAKSFKKISGLMNFSKETIRVVKLSFILSFLYNIIGLTFAVQGMLSPIIAAILMPLSSVTIVVFVSLTTAAIYTKYK